MPRDLNQLAKAIVDKAAGDAPPEEERSPESRAAALLGRKGGIRGGKARAESLSPRRRKQIAKKAAQARWAKKRSE